MNSKVDRLIETDDSVTGTDPMDEKDPFLATPEPVPR